MGRRLNNLIPEISLCLVKGRSPPGRVTYKVSAGLETSGKDRASMGRGLGWQAGGRLCLRWEALTGSSNGNEEARSAREQSRAYTDTRRAG